MKASGENIIRTMLEPKRADRSIRSLNIFLFNVMAVNKSRNKSKEKFKSQITSK
jgi:hypothetical protein